MSQERQLQRNPDVKSLGSWKETDGEIRKKERGRGERKQGGDTKDGK